AASATRTGAERPLKRRDAAQGGSVGSGLEPCAHEGERLRGGKLAALTVAAVAVFEPAGLEPALGHHQAVRNAQQLRVSELDSGARVAVVVQHFDPGGAELGVQVVADFADTGGF